MNCVPAETSCRWTDSTLASYSFDNLGRISTVIYGPTTGSDGLQYDGAGRLNQWSHGFNGDASQNVIAQLSYNPANQIRSRGYSNGLYEWGQTYQGINFTDNYNINGLNQITGTGSSSLSYNTRGSLANDGSNTYTYSTYNQLTQVAGSASATLAYDAGQRLVETTGSTSTLFVYDGSMIAEEMNSSSTVLRRYVPGPNGQPLVWFEGSGVSDQRWLYADQLGSIIAMMNTSGKSDGANTYDAYGMGASTNIGRFQYAGRPWIPEAGLYDNSARSYSPTLGRFLQTDPTGYADGMNWYAYAHNDPINGSDPTGLDDDPNYGPQVQGGNGGDNGQDANNGNPPSPPIQQYCTGSAFGSGQAGGPDPALDGGSSYPNGCSNTCGGSWVCSKYTTNIPAGTYPTVNPDGTLNYSVTYTSDGTNSTFVATYVPNSSGLAPWLLDFLLVGACRELFRLRRVIEKVHVFRSATRFLNGGKFLVLIKMSGTSTTA